MSKRHVSYADGIENSRDLIGKQARLALPDEAGDNRQDDFDLPEGDERRKAHEEQVWRFCKKCHPFFF